MKPRMIYGSGSNESFPKDLVSLAKWKMTRCAKRMKHFIKELGGNERGII